MSDRREVNVELPEHSWIPFYRELAEKLVNDSWRERQGELVSRLQGLQATDVPMPRLVEYMKEYVDPFTVFALFSREITFENALRVMRTLKSGLGIESDLPKVRPFIPYVDNRSVGYFSQFEGIEDEISTMWDLFEIVRGIDDFDEIRDHNRLLDLVDEALKVDHIGMSKLTGAFYWVNPLNFLHSDTVNAVGGRELRIEAVDGESYLKCLISTHELTSQPFPEINIAVWEGEEIELKPLDDVSERPNVWIVRGGSSGASVDYQLENGIAGVGFNLEDVDLSNLPDGEAVRQVYADQHPDARAGQISANASSLANFVFDLAVGDYLLMPEGDNVHYGTVASDPYHVEDGPWRNRRDVEWSPQIFQRYGLPSLPTRTRTVVKATDRLKGEFIALIESLDHRYKMPEDRWVEFHLDVAGKLVEGKWWLEDKRDEFVSMIKEVGLAVNENDGDRIWCPEPYSFFDSLSIHGWQNAHSGGYEKVRELFGIEAAVPLDKHLPYGLHWAWDAPIDDEAVSFIWEFFRFAVEFDPLLGDSDSERRFIDFYDRACSSDFLPGKGVGVWSYFVYWIDPTRYVLTRRLRENELGLAQDLGVSENLSTGDEYLRALRGIAELGDEYGFTVLDVNRRSTTREILGLDEDDDYHEDEYIEEERISYSVDDALEDGLFFERDELERILERLADKKNLILQGPPGVGKTFVSKRLAYALMGERADDRVVNVQFHQSYSYEEFVQGYRPDVNEREELVFKREDGVFLKLCDLAFEASQTDPDLKFVMIIDEINRGNLSRVFGELLSMIEKDKRGGRAVVELQSGVRLSVPDNVYILGTMNLADRSLAGMDYAMRRRFAFVTLKPQFGESVFVDWLRDRDVPDTMIEQINSRMSALNEVIAGDPSLGRNFAVGHSYFCDIVDGGEDDWDGWYREIVETEIRPLLEEYWFDDLKKADEEVDKLLEGDG